MASTESRSRGPEPLPALDQERVEALLATRERPYVTLKAATSLDGKIATRAGASQWITGEPARRYGHRLRGLHEALLVGIGTVLADDPRLTVRLPAHSPALGAGTEIPAAPGAGQETQAPPARVVLDSRCRIPPDARCLAADGARRFVVAGAEAPAGRIKDLRALGAEVLVCAGARPSPGEFLPLLRREGISTILVEGGGEVHANLIANRAADELFLILAGKVIGGSDAPGWCAALGVDTLEDAPRLRLQAPVPVGDDVVLHGFFEDR